MNAVKEREKESLNKEVEVAITIDNGHDHAEYHGQTA